jgi:3,4-dihydroxy-2-butanone 4-phosphate synthase
MQEISVALVALRAGGMVAVADGRDRDNEGELVMAASAMTAECMG